MGKNHVKSNGDFLEIIEMNILCAKKNLSENKVNINSDQVKASDVKLE